MSSFPLSPINGQRYCYRSATMSMSNLIPVFGLSFSTHIQKKKREKEVNEQKEKEKEIPPRKKTFIAFNYEGLLRSNKRPVMTCSLDLSPSLRTTERRRTERTGHNRPWDMVRVFQ